MPRPIRPTPGTCGSCWRRAAAGMLDPALAHPGMLGAAGDLSRPAGRAHRLDPADTRGAVPSGRAAARRAAPAHGEGLAALQAIAAAQLYPAGQLQIAVALDKLARWTATLTSCAAGCWRPPGSWPARGSCTRGCTGWGRSPRWRWCAGWAGRAGSHPPARRSGSPGWTSPSGPRTARAARAPVPAGTGGAALVRLRGRQDPRPRLRPRPRLLRLGQGPDRRQARAISEARKIIRQAVHILAELGDGALAAA